MFATQLHLPYIRHEDKRCDNQCKNKKGSKINAPLQLSFPNIQAYLASIIETRPMKEGINSCIMPNSQNFMSPNINSSPIIRKGYIKVGYIIVGDKIDETCIRKC